MGEISLTKSYESMKIKAVERNPEAEANFNTNKSHVLEALRNTTLEFEKDKTNSLKTGFDDNNRLGTWGTYGGCDLC